MKQEELKHNYNDIVVNCSNDTYRTILKEFYFLACNLEKENNTLKKRCLKTTEGTKCSMCDLECQYRTEEKI